MDGTGMYFRTLSTFVSRRRWGAGGVRRRAGAARAVTAICPALLCGLGGSAHALPPRAVPAPRSVPLAAPVLRVPWAVPVARLSSAASVVWVSWAVPVPRPGSRAEGDPRAVVGRVVPAVPPGTRSVCGTATPPGRLRGGSASGPSGYRCPLAGAVQVVRPFDPPPAPWLAGHRGVDLAGADGAPVHAAGAGTVAYVGVIAGRGVASVAHADGLRTTYEPVTASVRPGVHVGAGTVIGALDAGHPGCPARACLHWGLRHGATYLDPLALLGWGRSRLLP